jgi:hypothetical protein
MAAESNRTWKSQTPPSGEQPQNSGSRSQKTIRIDIHMQLDAAAGLLGGIEPRAQIALQIRTRARP